MTHIQVGWIADYIAEEIAEGGDLDSFDLDIRGVGEVTADDRFTLNGGRRKHKYLPVFVDANNHMGDR